MRVVWTSPPGVLRIWMSPDEVLAILCERKPPDVSDVAD